MKFLKPAFFVLNSAKGAASLPTILALAILILAIGIGVTSISFTESLISAGQSQSLKAFVYAEAGAGDALEKIARNKNYSGNYNIDFVSGGCSNNEGCAAITVTSGIGSSADPKIITSSGRVKSNVRKIQVDVVFDSSLNGEISTTTWREITN